MIRVAVVDDEPPARAKLRGLLAHEADVEIVGEAGDGVEAVELIVREQPDLVFLDIQMPRLSTVSGSSRRSAPTPCRRWSLSPPTTSTPSGAFEVHAVDYLLKPFAPSRLGRALDGYRRRPRGGAITRLGKLLAGAPQTHRRPETGARPQRTQPADPAVPRRCRCHPRSGERGRVACRRPAYRRRGTLAAMESRLDPEAFLRINRSEIVRIDAVAEIQPWFHGDAKIILKNSEVLAWSRRFRSRDRDRFEPGR